jgi:hypothetical protein
MWSWIPPPFVVNISLKKCTIQVKKDIDIQHDLIHYFMAKIGHTLHTSVQFCYRKRWDWKCNGLSTEREESIYCVGHLEQPRRIKDYNPSNRTFQPYPKYTACIFAQLEFSCGIISSFNEQSTESSCALKSHWSLSATYQSVLQCVMLTCGQNFRFPLHIHP